MRFGPASPTVKGSRAELRYYLRGIVQNQPLKLWLLWTMLSSAMLMSPNTGIPSLPPCVLGASWQIHGAAPSGRRTVAVS